MAENSKIEWTTHTFNPWRGCTKISPGCTNCYAETLSGRNPSVLGVWGPNGTRVVAAEAAWKEPVKWNRVAVACPDCGKDKRRCGHWPSGVPIDRPRVFCASLADVFEDWGGDMADAQGRPLLANQWLPSLGRGAGDRLTMSHVRERLGDLIRATPHLDWLLLTKRPEIAHHFAEDHMFGVGDDGKVWPANVRLGTSVENQAAADERLPHLINTPAAVRFISAEPLLGPVLLQHDFDGKLVRNWLGKGGVTWVIVGGESGPGARPMQVEWARSLVQQCRAAGVACFVKQLGARPVVDGPPDGYMAQDQRRLIPMRLADRKGGDMQEWPADLRVRQFPGVAR